MPDKDQRLGRILDWVQRDDERRSRERELPRASCRTCGGWAKAGEGSREDEPFRGLVPIPSDPSRRMLVTAPVAPDGADHWRRTCSTCATSAPGEIMAAVVGHSVSDEDAIRVIGRMRWFDESGILHVTFPTAQTSGRAAGRPWGHLTSEDRRQVREVLDNVIRERQIGPCTQGACGVCGVRMHRRWFEGPTMLRWPDGEPAPVCGDCFGVLNRRPEVTSIEQLRVVGVEAATGHSQMFYSAPDGFRVYAETKDCDGNGHARAWDYGDGIRQFREEMWTERPHLAPADRQAEFEDRRRKRVEEAQRQVRASRERENALAW